MTVLQLTGIARMIQRRQAGDVQSVVGMTKILSDSLEVAPAGPSRPRKSADRGCFPGR